MRKFHLKILLGILAVFGTTFLVLTLWEPGKLKYFAMRYKSGDVTTRAWSVGHLLKMGTEGRSELKRLFPDGDMAFDLLVRCWEFPEQLLKDNIKPVYFKTTAGKGFTLSTKSCNIIHIAAYNGYLETFRLFVEKGVDLNASSETYLLEKGRVGLYDISKLKPIHFATLGDRPEIIKYIHSVGGDLEIRCGESRTPMFYAAEWGCVQAIKTLAYLGAKINVAEKYNGYTPLHFAAMRGQADSIRALLALGADPELFDASREETPLHMLAWRGNLESTKLLAAKMKNVDAAGPSKVTALHKIADSSKIDMASFYSLRRRRKLSGCQKGNPAG